MTAGGSKSPACLGFLTVTEYADHGLFGGYLVLNAAARPLEFHCTAPVRANRAQQILYGPTLEPYLYGEQIAHTLVTKAKHRPLLICTDVVHVLALRAVVEIPVVQLLSAPGEEQAESGEGSRRLDGPHAQPAAGHLNAFGLGDFRVAVGRAYADDESLVCEHWARHMVGFDLEEPFGRIRSAIEEAQRSAR